MEFKNHIGILFIVIILCNFIELWSRNPFNNEDCDRWYIPTVAGIGIFLFVEVVYSVMDFCFS